MSNGSTGVDAKTLHPFLCAEEDYLAKAKLANLLYTVSTGDLLAAHEINFLRSNVDAPDFEGYPLHFALHMLLNHLLDNSPPPKLRAKCRRIIKIIRLLLEHHADANLVLEGQCPLTHACKMQHCELMELIAKYGANPSPQEYYVSSASFLLKPDLISRFTTIFKHYAANPFGRGPRPCPCLSGLPIAECHKKEDKPYSPEFICPRGSQKRFGPCCSKKNIFAYEQWNELLLRIQVS
ncbi:hypothetical protein EDD18DRAFT_353495 [Armillaria luteobubalina]|uniref:Uncharacterized protein n=1 Tax=Armillaria luteobubalina TaxID=153913 RepID=A0AA39URX4_9AGAR|nr:hypothetical protein EDD18DRAFT_353495 [Armillaria luteobubalina]